MRWYGITCCMCSCSSLAPCSLFWAHHDASDFLLWVILCLRGGEVLSCLNSPWTMKNHKVISLVNHWVILECHLLRQLTIELAWKDQHRIFRPEHCVMSFLDSLPCRPGPPVWLGAVHNQVSYPEWATKTQALVVKLYYGWCLHPVVSQSRGKGRHFKVIEFSNWNFKSNWEKMSAFPIWKASAGFFPPWSYFHCI